MGKCANHGVVKADIKQRVGMLEQTCALAVNRLKSTPRMMCLMVARVCAPVVYAVVAKDAVCLLAGMMPIAVAPPKA